MARKYAVKKTRAWVALLLFLNVTAHPVLHQAPLLVTSSGPTTLSASVTGNQSPSPECDLCRTASRFVLAIELPLAEAINSSSPVVAQSGASVLRIALTQSTPRAPPVC